VIGPLDLITLGYLKSGGPAGLHSLASSSANMFDLADHLLKRYPELGPHLDGILATKVSRRVIVGKLSFCFISYQFEITFKILWECGDLFV
jgi:hypothetical protein